jgi:hypothetical protein
MPTPAEIMDMSASLMNDTAQTTYTDEAQLPYLNMALNELQELFELNNIPVTNEESAQITLAAGITVVSFTSTPALPANLVEIQRLWERFSGVIPYIPMTRKEFIPKSQEDQQITQFLIWAWIDQEIRLIAATAAIDIKIDYIKSIFATPIVIGGINTNLTTINIKQFLGFRTAALCSLFIGENEVRADTLDARAERALDRTLGIPIKGRQAITTRRQPFMARWKRRGYV